MSEIPQKVLELAAEMGWLSAAIFDVSRPAPPDNPAGSAKKYLVEPAYRTWLWDLLEARAEYWRARMYAEPSDGELLKPEFVVRPLPAATPEGLVFQAEDSLTERRESCHTPAPCARPNRRRQGCQREAQMKTGQVGVAARRG